MAIQKMKHVYIHGPENMLSDTLGVLCDLACFQPDTALQSGAVSNPYRAPLAKLMGLLSDIGEEVDLDGYTGKEYELHDISKLVGETAQTVHDLSVRRSELISEIEEYERADIQLRHIRNMGSDFDHIFKCSFIKVRFGRLPKDSFVKLDYFEEQPFIFQHYDFDGEWYWGVYFTDTPHSAIVDEIFKDLYFERIRVPDFAHGTPQDALALFTMYERSLKEELDSLPDIYGLAGDVTVMLKSMAQFLAHRERLYELHGYATRLDFSFYMPGYVPQDMYKELEGELKNLEGVHMIVQEAAKADTQKLPTMLKNNRLVKPFEFFVKMYGLPSSDAIDPTTFVAITYTILFGIMFADVGQGLFLSAVGLYLGKKMQNPLGPILTRVGISSALFGLVFGSVFGFEYVLDPMYHALGFAEKPIHALSATWATTLLVVAVGIGVFMTITVITMNIITGIKQRNIKSRIFSPNGIVGLVFYLSVLLLVLDMLVLQTGLTAVFAIPLAISGVGIIFTEPLNHLAHGHSIKSLKVGEVVTGATVETFEVLLAYMTNTLSYLRVGGFILVHAGMMTVVFKISELVGGGIGSVIVIIIGNLFVIAMEGLIVGIQVLRLEFYEMFSRYYVSDGVPFTPIRLKTKD